MLQKLAQQLERSVQIEREARSFLAFVDLLAKETTDENVRGTALAILDRGPVFRLRKLLKEGDDG